jgi:hypothetical protein
MKKMIMPIAAFALVTFAAGSASAQCNFDVVAKAKGLKSSMIRAFAACPSTENPSINTETGGGTSACEPVTPLKDDGGTGQSSEYSFNGKGGCSVQTSSKIVPDCSTLEDNDDVPLLMPAGPCHVVYVKAKCKGIVKEDGVTPIDATFDNGWSLATLSRASLDDNTNGDMTVIDFPVTFQFDDPKNGGLSLSSNSAIELTNFLGDPASAALPTCTQIEALSLLIKDPDGRVFATLGGGTATTDQAFED